MRLWCASTLPLLQENKLTWIVSVLLEDVHEILWLCAANRSHAAEKLFFGFLLPTFPDCEVEEGGIPPFLVRPPAANGQRLCRFLCRFKAANSDIALDG